MTCLLFLFAVLTVCVPGFAPVVVFLLLAGAVHAWRCELARIRDRPGKL